MQSLTSLNQSCFLQNNSSSIPINFLFYSIVKVTRILTGFKTERINWKFFWKFKVKIFQFSIIVLYPPVSKASSRVSWNQAQHFFTHLYTEYLWAEIVETTFRSPNTISKQGHFFNTATNPHWHTNGVSSQTEIQPAHSLSLYALTLLLLGDCSTWNSESRLIAIHNRR